MEALEKMATQRLQALEAAQLRRRLTETTAGDGVRVMRDGRALISFSGNDYLGLAQDARVIAAAQAALAEHGAGGGASRLVTGEHPLYGPLEAALAAAKGYGAARVFGSGYLTNLGVLSALMEEGDLILLDKLSHACLLDGARLSGARWMRFKHNDTDDLARLLAKHRGAYRHCLIVSETIFSMDGDRAPLADLRALADSHDSWLMADDAHGLFALCSPLEGEPAKPSAAPVERWGDTPHASAVACGSASAAPPQGGSDLRGPHLLTGTLSKALGSYGGYVAASQTVIDYLTTAARSLIFTTALPPATIAAAHAALAIAQAEPQRAQAALGHARRFCAALGLPEPESQIVPILLGEAALALQTSQQLEAAGFLVSAIRPPTVPPGTARLRVSFSAAHTEAQVAALAEALRPLLAAREHAA